MKTMLLAAAGTIAMLTASALPAQAQNFGGPESVGASRGGGQDGRGDRFSRQFDDNDSGDRRRSRGDLILGYGYGEWARYNNRTFDSDSFNDWWHDRPDRAYPRWLLKNSQTCERQWSSGAGWTC